MNPQLKSHILQIFNNYKSVNQMLKGNNMILDRLGYHSSPELSKAFCLGAVFAEISFQIDIYSLGEAPDTHTLSEATELFLGFVRGDYENED